MSDQFQSTLYTSMAVLRCLRSLRIGTNYPIERVMSCPAESVLKPNSVEVSAYRIRLEQVLNNLGKRRTDDYAFFLQFRELLIFLFSDPIDYQSDVSDTFGEAKFSHKTLKWERSGNLEAELTIQDVWRDGGLLRPRIIADSILVKLNSQFREFIGQELRGRFLANFESEFDDRDRLHLDPDFKRLTYAKQISAAIEHAEERGFLQPLKSFESAKLNLIPERVATVSLNPPAEEFNFSLYCNGLVRNSDVEHRFSEAEGFDLISKFRGKLRWKRKILEQGHGLGHKEAMELLLQKSVQKQSLKKLREEFLVELATECINDELAAVSAVLSQLLYSPDAPFKRIRLRYFKGDFESQEESWLALCQWRKYFDNWEDTFTEVSKWADSGVSLFHALMWDSYGCSPNHADIASLAGFLPCTTPASITEAQLTVNEENLHAWHPLQTDAILHALSLGFSNAKQFLETNGNGLSKKDVEHLSSMCAGTVPVHLLHRYQEFQKAGISQELAIKFSIIEHITFPQAIELAAIDKPINEIVLWATEVKNHSIRMRWLTAHNEISLAEGLIYAKHGISLANYRKTLARKSS